MAGFAEVLQRTAWRLTSNNTPDTAHAFPSLRPQVASSTDAYRAILQPFTQSLESVADMLDGLDCQEKLDELTRCVCVCVFIRACICGCMIHNPPVSATRS